MTKYWVAVASREHVLRGREGGFMQVCHGKAEPLRRAVPGDWVVYYSPVEIFGEKAPCQKFTALGRIATGEPYQVEMVPDFIPWRRKVNFSPTAETSIRPLIAQLDFIQNKERWGFPFRRGIFAIAEKDFQIIAKQMGAWPI